MSEVGRIRFLEPGELRRLMNQPSLDSLTGLRNRCIMGLCYECALRIGEALELKPRDVVLDERRVWVVSEKNGHDRTVFFDRADDLKVFLELWKERRPRSRYIFCTIKGSNKGKRLDATAFRDTFRRYVKRAGLPPWVTPHVLRHTRATELMRNKVPLRVIQDILGHKSVKTTQIYTHVFEDDIRRAMKGT